MTTETIKGDFQSFLNAEPSFRFLTVTVGSILSSEYMDIFSLKWEEEFNRILFKTQKDQKIVEEFCKNWDLLLAMFFNEQRMFFRERESCRGVKVVKLHGVYAVDSQGESLSYQDVQDRINSEMKEMIIRSYLDFSEQTGQKLKGQDFFLRAVILLYPEFETRAMALVEEKAAILWDKFYLQSRKEDRELCRNPYDEPGEVVYQKDRVSYVYDDLHLDLKIVMGW